MRVLILVYTMFLFGCSYPTYNIVRDSYNTYSPTYSSNYTPTYAPSNTTTYRPTSQPNKIAVSKTPPKKTKVRIIVAGSPKRYGD